MTWQKGQSGTPGGGPRAVEGVERLARTHSTEASHTLARLMRTGPVPAVRLGAANALLDRAWGKPWQQIDAVRQEVLPPSELTNDEIHARLAEGKLS